MRIAICDDEQQFLSDFRHITDRLYKSLDMLVDSFSDGAALLKQFRLRAYDLVFLDIEMPEMDGITLAEELRALSDTVSIVFLTGHIEYAILGYEVNALRYLTKPADEQKIRAVIDHVLQKTENEKTLWIRTDEGEIRLRLAEILFIESQNQNVVISTDADSYSVRGNMRDLGGIISAKAVTMRRAGGWYTESHIAGTNDTAVIWLHFPKYGRSPAGKWSWRTERGCRSHAARRLRCGRHCFHLSAGRRSDAGLCFYAVLMGDARHDGH